MLRPYQQQAITALRESYRRGNRRALVVMPTGTGKTVLFAEVSRLAKGPVLVLAHRQELVEQARDKISAWCDDVVAVEMAQHRDLTDATRRRPKISVASVQTMARRCAKIPRDAFKIVVIDEAHHATAATYGAILDHFERAWVLGVTATPDRADRQQLGTVFSDVAFSYDMQSAIRDGWLCPIKSFMVQTDIDFSEVRKVAGELATGDVERIMTKEPHLAEVAHPIVRERGDRPTMVFAASVAHAYALSRVLCELTGDPNFAAAIDGSTHSDRRSHDIERFRRGELRALVNCALFTEGFDVPQIALVAIARPVLSRAFYAQMVGRGTRIAEGKRDLLVLDFAPGNCRHSLVQAIDIFAGDDSELADEARKIARERGAEGEALALEQALELARQVVEARRASVEYQLVHRDPFALIGFDAQRMGPRGGGAATEEQVAYLRRAGLTPERAANLTRRQAEQLQEHLRERKAVGLCSPRQARELAAFGIDPEDMYQDQAKTLLAAIRQARKNGMSTERLKADIVEHGPGILDLESEG